MITEKIVSSRRYNVFYSLNGNSIFLCGLSHRHAIGIVCRLARAYPRDFKFHGMRGVK